MARPREFDEAKVLRAARDAFRAKGYAGTSLQDLLDATGLGKGSLYAAFGDKHGLYLRALDHYANDGVAATRDALAGPRAIDALRDHLVDLARASTSGPSCMLASSTAELANTDPVVHERVDAAYREIEASFVGAVRRAQAEGDVDPAADPEALGAFLLTITRGLDALGHGGASEADLLRTVETALAALPRQATPTPT